MRACVCEGGLINGAVAGGECGVKEEYFFLKMEDILDISLTPSHPPKFEPSPSSISFTS